MGHESFGVHARVASDVLYPFEQSYRRRFADVRVSLEVKSLNDLEYRAELVCRTLFRQIHQVTRELGEMDVQERFVVRRVQHVCRPASLERRAGLQKEGHDLAGDDHTSYLERWLQRNCKLPASGRVPLTALAWRIRRKRPTDSLQSNYKHVI